MESNLYHLAYLPSALDDILETVGYIRYELNNPSAAERLNELFFKAADDLILFPYKNSLYIPKRRDMTLQYEYRKKFINNYIMIYRVDEDKKRITIVRIIYNRRNNLSILY